MGEKCFVNSKQLPVDIKMGQRTPQSFNISRNSTLAHFLGRKEEPREDIKRRYIDEFPRPLSSLENEILGCENENYGCIRQVKGKAKAKGPFPCLTLWEAAVHTGFPAPHIQEWGCNSETMVYCVQAQNGHQSQPLTTLPIWSLWAYLGHGGPSVGCGGVDCPRKLERA